MRSASSQLVTSTVNRAPRSGLTLFEVLLSLAILAAAMAAIAQLVSSGVQASVRARLQSEAIIRCQSQLAELIAVGDPLSAVADQPFADDPAWTWSISAAETEQPGLVQLVMTVTHDPGDGFGDVSYTIPRFYRDPIAAASLSATEPEDDTGVTP
ncbi:prepilin-type N-terminal cleavage/methylation domain-containing protein [Symmachiella dynata]|uniref:prepilin-type N-terminal cleavage/methylation domain-containing protein n=1 Tax=Symmachiella dynata TaxID=2527995 RepID=UPI0030EC8A24